MLYISFMKKISIYIFLFLVFSVTIYAQILPDSLILYVPFSGNANDYSGNNFHGTMNGAVLTADKDGVPNNACYFDGTDDYVEFPVDSILDPDFPFTVAAWIYSYDYAGTGFRVIASDFKTDHYYTGFWILIDIYGYLAMGVGDGGGIGSSSYRSRKSSIVLSNYTWYYIVCVFNDFNDFTIYIDCEDRSGVYAGAGSSYVKEISRPLSLGRHNSGYPSHTYGQGIIDEVSIWSRAVPASEILGACGSNDTILVEIDTAFCEGTQFLFEGQTISAEGDYTFSYTSVLGYDSIIILHASYIEMPTVTLPEDFSMCYGESYTLNPLVNGTYLSYQWSDSYTEFSRIIIDEGLYVFEVTNECGTVQDDVYVTIDSCLSEIWFPNVFTPNGDIHNPVFKPEGVNIFDFRMMIFNRWGQLVFETNDFEAGWDGTFKGKECPEGVYFWIATYSLYGNTDMITESAKGSVTLFR